MTIYQGTTIKIDQVQVITGLDKQGIYAAIRDKGFPKPSNTGMRRGGWHEPLVRAWMQQRGHA